MWHLTVIISITRKRKKNCYEQASTFILCAQSDTPLNKGLECLEISCLRVLIGYNCRSQVMNSECTNACTQRYRSRVIGRSYCQQNQTECSMYPSGIEEGGDTADSLPLRCHLCKLSTCSTSGVRVMRQSSAGTKKVTLPPLHPK